MQSVSDVRGLTYRRYLKLAESFSDEVTRTRVKGKIHGIKRKIIESTEDHRDHSEV